jgi:hypothetical protein
MVFPCPGISKPHFPFPKKIKTSTFRAPGETSWAVAVEAAVEAIFF